MAFDEEAMDVAYKSLETTEHFCDVGNKKFSLFSSNSLPRQEQFSPHEKLRRRAIIADCIFFEAVIVFLKQGLTSYVKGGYLLRKAYKLYEKIFQETEELCKQTSPISRLGVASDIDRHVGSSIYDRETVKVVKEDDEAKIEDAQIDEANLGKDPSSLHIGLMGMDASDGDGASGGGARVLDTASGEV